MIKSRIQRVEEAARFPLFQIDLDAPLPDSSDPLGDVLLPASPAVQETALDQLQHRDLFGSLLADLDHRSRIVISMLYGLDGGPQLSMAEIARVFGLSRERIRQVEERAIKEMRATLGVTAKKKPRRPCRIPTR
jgi:RNA polymerase primary sigma factor